LGIAVKYAVVNCVIKSNFTLAKHKESLRGYLDVQQY